MAEARHGEDALRVIEQTAEPFDLVVTEMIMPVMSGYKLGRRLARQRPGLPVLYMSAAANETLVRSGPPSGRPQFLRKPFLPEDLVRQVTESLRPLVQEGAAGVGVSLTPSVMQAPQGTNRPQVRPAAASRR